MNYCTKCKKVLTKKEMKGDGSGYTSTGSYYTCIYCGECCQFTSKNTRNEGVPVREGDNEPKDKNDLKRRYCQKCDKWLNHPASYDSYSYYSGGHNNRDWIECRTCHEEIEFCIVDNERTNHCFFCLKRVRVTGEKEPKTNMERMLPFTNTEGKVNHDCEAECQECKIKFKPTNETVGLLIKYTRPYCITCRIKDLEGSEKAEEKAILVKLKKIKGAGDGSPNSPSNSPPVASEYLPTLQNVLDYITANNIHSITEQNGNLIITFNSSANNTSPPQTITETQLTDNNFSLGQEQKTMWQKFKEWMKKNGKSSLNNQELKKLVEQEKSKQSPRQEKGINWTPWIISGGIIGVLVIGVIIYFLVRKEK